MNTEIHNRLEQSFEDKAHGDIWSIARDIESVWHGREARDELHALAKVMVEVLQRDGTAEEVAERVKALCAGPVRKWCALEDFMEQQLREARLAPEERMR